MVEPTRWCNHGVHEQRASAITPLCNRAVQVHRASLIVAEGSVLHTNRPFVVWSRGLCAVAVTVLVCPPLRCGGVDCS